MNPETIVVLVISAIVLPLVGWALKSVIDVRESAIKSVEADKRFELQLQMIVMQFESEKGTRARANAELNQKLDKLAGKLDKWNDSKNCC